MSIARSFGFDAAVLDREDLPVALIEVKSSPPVNGWSNWLRDMLNGNEVSRTEFLIAIDLTSIQFFPVKDTTLGEPVVFDTAAVLSRYDADFSGKRIFEPYLLTLVEAWLRDLAYHWKSPSPPGSNELKSLGFLNRIEGGTTRSAGE